MTTLAMGENADGTMMTPQMIKMQAALMTRADPEAGGGMHLMTQAFPESGGDIGDKGIMNINTMVVGEQGGSILNPGGGGGNFGPPNLGTLAMPENGGSFGPVTMAVGEDGGGFPPLQMPKLPGGGTPPLMTLGMESGGGIGGGMPIGTKMLGENGRPPQNITTQAVYENGRPPQMITQAAGIGEDGRPPQMPITQMVGEDGAIGSPSIPGQNPFDFSTFKTDLLAGIGDLFKKYFDETSSPFGGNEITPPPAPGEKKPAMSPGDLVAPSSNYGSLASKGMQSPFRGI